MDGIGEGIEGVIKMTEEKRYEMHIVYRDDDNAQPMTNPHRELIIRPITASGIVESIMEKIATVEGLSEHFTAIFDRVLRDEYTIKIEDYEFDPSRVLLDCKTTEDEMVYGKVCKSWLTHHIELEIIPRMIRDDKPWTEEGLRIWVEPYVWYVVRIPEREYADKTEIIPEYTLEDALESADILWERANPQQESAINKGWGIFDVIEVTSEFFDNQDEQYIVERHWDYANE